MTRTIISSATREVVIADDGPFTIIGERINPTGRRRLAEEMRAGDFSRVERDALAQVAAGARMLDVNAGIPLADEPAILARTVQLVQSLVDVPLAIDSSIVEALEAGLAVYQGKALVNSVTGEEERLEAGDYRVTVAVHDGRQVTGVWPGLHDRAYGVAIDVGSTTIAGHLANLADGAVLASSGVMNPQIRFGEDLMSRVSYAMLHPEGAGEMTRVVRAALAKLVTGLATSAGIDPRDILELTVVGNPVMHHLLLGIDPVPLGSAPFALATDRAVRTTAAELGIRAHPGARLYVLPCIAGHVGADTAGVILAQAPHRAEAMTLIVDVGTNAEIVLGNRERLLAASSPTGPAFEGAQISAGQRAAPGAIERVRIDRETLEPRLRVIGSDRWSDEPGFAASVGADGTGTGVTGICGSGIVEVIAELFLAGVITAEGVIDGGAAARTPRLVPDGRTWAFVLHDGPPRITITQNDVRAIQLAKAALYAGARLLMDQAGVDHVDEIRLAGAFGSQIDVTHAMVLGLIPDADLARVGPAGNAAGTGALIALLSATARREIEDVARRVEKIETAVEPRFQEHFVDAMALPHRTAGYPNLARAVQLPDRMESARATRSERRSRRVARAAEEVSR